MSLLCYRPEEKKAEIYNMTVKTIFISIFDGERIEESYKDVDTIIDGYGLGESSLIQLTLKYKDGTTQSVACHSFEIEPDEVVNKNHGCDTTFDDLIDMADKIDMSRKEEAKKYLVSLLDNRKQHIDISDDASKKVDDEYEEWRE